MSDSIAARQASPRLFARSALAATVGTTVEWYDFQIYGLASALVFNKQFFPSVDPLAGTLLAFATFAVGFLARPIGGIVFGHMGDRIGRKATLITTFVLTGMATFLVGCLPTYDAVGPLAPAALVLLRLLQGVGLGGEWGGAVLVMTEGGSQSRRGLLGSLPQLGSPGGLILATVAFSATTASLSADQFAAWGWRLPFLLTLLLVAVGMVARVSMPETPAFVAARATHAIARAPLIEAITTHWRQVLLTGGLFLVTSGGFYVYVTFMVAYGSTDLGLPRELMLRGVLVFAVCELVVIPPFCGLSDRWGRRPIFIAAALFTIVFAFPLFWLVNTKDTGLIFLGMGVGGIANGVLFGIMGSLGPELFRTNVRYTGASLGYQLSAALGGGLTPLIATALVRAAGGAYWPAPLWLALLAAVSLVTCLLTPETRSRTLDL